MVKMVKMAEMVKLVKAVMIWEEAPSLMMHVLFAAAMTMIAQMG